MTPPVCFWFHGNGGFLNALCAPQFAIEASESPLRIRRFSEHIHVAANLRTRWHQIDLLHAPPAGLPKKMTGSGRSSVVCCSTRSCAMFSTHRPTRSTYAAHQRGNRTWYLYTHTRSLTAASNKQQIFSVWMPGRLHYVNDHSCIDLPCGRSIAQPSQTSISTPRIRETTLA